MASSHGNPRAFLGSEPNLESTSFTPTTRKSGREKGGMTSNTPWYEEGVTRDGKGG